MDIRPNRPATADAKTIVQTQKNQGESSLLFSRMAIRTMLEDLETLKEKNELAESPTKKMPAEGLLAAKIPVIPVPLPPASLLLPKKEKNQTAAPPSSPVEKILSQAQETIEEILTKKTTTEKAPNTDGKEAKAKEAKAKEEAALKIKEEQQKIKEAQKEAQRLARQEEKERKEEEKRKKEAQRADRELAEKSKKEAELAKKAEAELIKQKGKEEINKKLEQARLEYEAGAFEAAAELAKKILENKDLSWLLSFRVNQLLKKSAAGLRQKQIEQIKEATKIKDADNLKKLMETLPSAAPIPPSLPEAPKTTSAPKITSAPPVNLPTLQEEANVLLEPLEKNEKPALPSMPLIQKTKPSPVSSVGTSSVLTELLSEVPEEAERQTSFEFLKSRRLLIIGGSLVLVLLLTGLGWWLLGREGGNSSVIFSPSASPTFSATPIPSVSEPTPKPLLTVDKQRIIELKKSQKNIEETLLTLALVQEPAGTIEALMIKNNQDKFITLDQIAQELNWEIFNTPTQSCGQQEEDCLGSKTLKDLLDMTKFSLFVFSQSSSSTGSSPFASSTATNKGRLGLVINLKETASSTKDQLLKSLKDLEALLPSEFASLFLEKATIPQNPAFSQTTYKNTSIRYLNLPSPGLAIDYAIVDQKLVLTTSKDSMLAAIDRLVTATGTETISP